jgi:hypothetical protein
MRCCRIEYTVKQIGGKMAISHSETVCGLLFGRTINAVLETYRISMARASPVPTAPPGRRWPFCTFER